MDFSCALAGIKNGRSARRSSWKPNKVVTLRPAQHGTMSYIEIVYTDGTNRRAPWIPTRCDILEEDWSIAA